MNETEEMQLNLKWDNFSSHLALSFDSCYESQQFVDVSLVCKDGDIIKGHKMILANTSKFFRRLLTENEHPHPMIVLHNIEADDLRNLMTFMYCGEVQIFQNDLKRLLEIADILEITGLQQIQESDNTASRSSVKNLATVNSDSEQLDAQKNNVNGEMSSSSLNKSASNLLKCISTLGQKNLDNSVKSFESSSRKLQQMAQKFERSSNVGSWSFLQHAQNSPEAKIKEITTDHQLKTFQSLPSEEPGSLEYKSSSRKLQEMAKLLENTNRNPASSEVAKDTLECHKRSLDLDENIESPCKKANLNPSTSNTPKTEQETEHRAKVLEPMCSISDEQLDRTCNIIIKDELDIATDCSENPDLDSEALQNDPLNITSNDQHSGTSMLAAELLKAVANKRKDNWKSYFEEKFVSFEKNIIAEIRSNCKRIKDELEGKINAIKVVKIVSNGGEAQAENISSARERLGIPLPITNFEDYLAFEQQLSADEDKRRALKSLFTILIAGPTSWKDDVGRLINSVMSKAVQLHFSGCGKKVRGEGKRNFSGTGVFKCMKDVLEECHKDDMTPSDMMSRVSRWLSTAGDREGGRRARN